MNCNEEGGRSRGKGRLGVGVGSVNYIEKGSGIVGGVQGGFFMNCSGGSSISIGCQPEGRQHIIWPKFAKTA